MLPSLEDRRRELTVLCQRYRVQRLELFGSAVSEQFDPERSDVDFLVQFQPLVPAEHADSYFGLKGALETLFQREVDLVELPAIRNPYFLQAIAPTRVVLYAA